MVKRGRSSESNNGVPPPSLAGATAEECLREEPDWLLAGSHQVLGTKLRIARSVDPFMGDDRVATPHLKNSLRVFERDSEGNRKPHQSFQVIQDQGGRARIKPKAQSSSIWRPILVSVLEKQSIRIAELPA